MAVNTFVPAGLTNSKAYNWSRPNYSAANVPVDTTDPQVRRQWAYEWLDFGDGKGAATNPPFTAWEAGQLPPSLRAKDAQGNITPARILRGYIRRAQTTAGDTASNSRLYFMYNPETITRNYVSYLDQGALDPFNTVFQSGNLVAPPSYMDFSFQLFFDRQSEAQDPEHPGVLVDMEYFDLVVRNVVPGDNTNGQLPDNGVMMVNPRDITVIFSPTLTVQGRPTNASVVYEKFTHRMTPTRMRIDLTMRVVYLGPVKDITTFVQDDINIPRRIPFDIVEPPEYAITFRELVWENNGQDIDPSTLSNATDDERDDVTPTNNLGAVAAQNAYELSSTGGTFTTKYTKNQRNKLWQFADCSSYVWGGFVSSPDIAVSITTTLSTEMMTQLSSLGITSEDLRLALLSRDKDLLQVIIDKVQKSGTDSGGLQISEAAAINRAIDALWEAGKDARDKPATGQSVATYLGWPTFTAGVNGYPPDVATMWNTFSGGVGGKKVALLLYGGGQSSGTAINSEAWKAIMEDPGCEKGDILIRFNHPDRPGENHVAFFWEKTSSGEGFKVLHAASEDLDICFSTYSKNSTTLQYNYGFRVFKD